MNMESGTAMWPEAFMKPSPSMPGPERFFVKIGPAMIDQNTIWANLPVEKPSTFSAKQDLVTFLGA